VVYQVPLGIILKNENTTEGMVHILGELHRYVPTKPYKEDYTTTGGEVIQIPKAAIHPVLFGGDQLTAARARGAKLAKVNSIDPRLRFEGLIPFAEDWHTKLNFLGVC
jgi:L1 cell adhesion molecule like protein